MKKDDARLTFKSTIESGLNSIGHIVQKLSCNNATLHFEFEAFVEAVDKLDLLYKLRRGLFASLFVK